jgi:HD-GYP domain-containing protein (c-di-GMP phosphodiesterase class II)
MSKVPMSADPVVAVLNLRATLDRVTQEEERIECVYRSVSEWMRYLFETSQLQLDALESSVEAILSTLQSQNAPFAIVLRQMPDTYSTHHHCTNVAFLSAILGGMMKMSRPDQINLVSAALLHDVGKLRIDETILEKPSYLEEEEYELVKQHSALGCAYLEENGLTDPAILKGILHHHEHLDGSGYPQGLKGKIIPKISRIIAVCDTFDALTTRRTFRKNYTSFEALLSMKREMSAQFDETMVDMFIQLHRQGEGT